MTARRIFIVFLVALLLNSYFPRVILAQVGELEEEAVQRPPEMRATPEENIPVETVKTGGAIPTWIWVGLGVVVAGAALAIAGASGGGGGGGSSSAPASSASSGNKGSVGVAW